MIKGIDNYQNNIYTRIQNVQNDAALKKINEQAAEVPVKDQEEAKGSALDLRLDDPCPSLSPRRGREPARQPA